MTHQTLASKNFFEEIERNKKKGYPKVKADEEPAKNDDKFEPERVLIPGIIEGYSSFKTASGKIPEKTNTK